MAQQDRATLKTYFNTGDTPTEDQFSDFIDSTQNITDDGVADVDGHAHATSDITSGTLADARVAESNVTQHESAISVTESQISDLDHDAVKIQGVGVDATVSSPSDGDILVYRSAGSDFILEAKPAGGSSPAWGDITGTLASQTDLQSAIDAKASTSHAHATSDITSGTLADALVAQSNVTQHQSALTITESQISDLSHDIASASTTVSGKVELATITETNTGSDTGRAITPDALAGSVHGIRNIQVTVVDYTTDVATGDGQAYFHIPSNMNGMDLTYCHAQVITAGTTGTTDIQIHNLTQTADMLTTKLTIDSAETGSDTATAYVIDTANDDIATNDLLRIDVDAISTTAPKGLIVTLGFKLP